MRLRSVIDLPVGMRYCFELLDLKSGFSRQYLLDTCMMTNRDAIESAHNELREFYRLFIEEDRNQTGLQTIQFKLQRLKDITGSINGLSSGRILDEIELFEIKSLAILNEEISEFLSAYPIRTLELNDLKEVIAILNPDRIISTSFYIYDSYSEELKVLREKIKRLGAEDQAEREELIIKCKDIEAQVRTMLSAQLKSYSEVLMGALLQLAKIDTLIARILLMREYSWIIPNIIEGKPNKIEGLFNPYIKDILNRKGKDFQPVDISFGGITVIVGANMGGKTVLLKSLALTQLLFQFGFPVPASDASLTVKEDIFLSVGDGQSEEEGISSFGAEMLKINKILAAARSGVHILALIDEPARSTNPIEGTALVSSLIDILTQYDNVDLVLATHYNLESGNYRGLKVKGPTETGMDYSLSDVYDSHAPMEALRIASSMGIDSKWLSEAEKRLKK